MRYLLVTWIRDPNSHTVYEMVGKHVFIVREFDRKCLRNTTWKNIEEVRKVAESVWHCDFIHEFNDIKELDRIFMALELMK